VPRARVAAPVMWPDARSNRRRAGWLQAATRRARTATLSGGERAVGRHADGHSNLHCPNERALLPEPEKAVTAGLKSRPEFAARAATTDVSIWPT
jgi:hypothetical protein